MPLASPLFEYVSKIGLASSASYPNRGMDVTCQVSATSCMVLIMRGFEEVSPLDEFQMLRAVTFGPVVVSIAVKDHNNDFRRLRGRRVPVEASA